MQLSNMHLSDVNFITLLPSALTINKVEIIKLKSSML